MASPEASRFNPSYVGPRPDIAALVPADARTVLDVGCSVGSLGAALKSSRPLEVVGLEGDAGMAEEARTKLDAAYHVDLNDPHSLAKLEGRSFCCLIFADVLEHLIDPWTVLQSLTRLLRPGGSVITSIPNVRHHTTLLALGLGGRWPYRNRGIHDRTHLRFFTRKNIVELLAGAGLEPVVERRNLRFLEHIHPINRGAVALDFWPFRPFLTFQYLHVSKHRSE